MGTRCLDLYWLKCNSISKLWNQWQKINILQNNQILSACIKCPADRKLLGLFFVCYKTLDGILETNVSLAIGCKSTMKIMNLHYCNRFQFKQLSAFNFVYHGSQVTWLKIHLFHSDTNGKNSIYTGRHIIYSHTNIHWGQLPRPRGYSQIGHHYTIIYVYICVHSLYEFCYRSYIQRECHSVLAKLHPITLYRGVRGSWSECHFVFSLVYQLCLALW